MHFPEPVDLVPYGWNDPVANLYATFHAFGRRPGRVARVDRGSSLIVVPGGTCRASPVPSKPLDGSEAGPPVTGDWVAVGLNVAGDPAIDAILPRRSAVMRRDPSSRESRPARQVLAANIDQVFIVHGLDRHPQPGRIERTLVVAWDSGAVPVIVLTKTDLVDPSYVVDVASDLEELAPGTTVVAVSNATGVGFERLAPMVGAGTTVALLGASGTGKSSLVNRMLGSDELATGDTRRGDGKGRHTTTVRQLIPLPSGGVLIDTPGLREVGVLDSWSGLGRAFDDIVQRARLCRFRDCGHGSEPGCAVTDAIEKGTLERRRLESYHRMERELAHLERQAQRRKDRPSPQRRRRTDRRTDPLEGW